MRTTSRLKWLQFPLSLGLAAAGIAFAISAKAEPLALEPITVSVASRHDVPITDTLSSVTLITRNQIDNAPQRTLPELLRTVPGAQVSQNGGVGANASVGIRGASATETLVLVDGVRVSSATSGAAALENLPLDSIERIEVLRGARSSLYGSDAIGGVINVITRDGSECKGGSCLTVGAGWGSRGTKETTAQTSLALGQDTRLTLGTKWGETNGTNFRRPTPGKYGVNEPDHDGSDNTAYNANFRTKGERYEATAMALRSEGTTDFDNSPGSENVSDYSTEVFSATGRYFLTDDWSVELTPSYARDKSRSYRHPDTIESSLFETSRKGLTGITNYSFGNDLTQHHILAGVDYTKDEVESTTAYDVDSRDNTGSFIQYTAEHGAYSWAGGLRSDDNEQFGRHNTGNVGLGYELTSAIKLRATYTTGFRAPTFNDLYYPGYSNPNLKPETSKGYEFGITYTGDNDLIDVAYFHTKLEDMIAYDTLRYNTYNIAEATLKGIETTYIRHIGQFALNSSLTLLDPEDDNTGKTLRNRAKVTGSFGVNYGFDNGVTIGTTATYVGKRYSDAANKVDLDPYTLIGVMAQYAFTPATKATLTLDNLTDRDYEPVGGYYGVGRTAMLRVSHTFDL